MVELVEPQTCSSLTMNRNLARSVDLPTKRLISQFGKPTAQIIKRSYASKAEKKDSKSKAAPQQQVFDPRFIGLTRDIYIPVSYSKLPWSSPRSVWNSLIRRVYVLGVNTIQVALLRYQTGLSPQFLLWKNKAIENYVAVNKAFAKNEIKSIEKQVSVWVEKSLTTRSHSIPKDTKLDWKLVKFNEKPKLVSFRPIMLPGRPVEFAQVVYKFNTKQELINVNLKTDKVKKVDRDVIDYAGFLIDLDTNNVTLAGTVFENSPQDRIPKPEDIDQSMIFEDMRINGDIYRAPPTLPQNTTRETK